MTRSDMEKTKQLMSLTCSNMKPLPDVCAVQRIGDRWLAVSVSEGSLAAGRTFDRRELRARSTLSPLTRIPPVWPGSEARTARLLHERGMHVKFTQAAAHLFA
jgi:hypothetical protein